MKRKRTMRVSEIFYSLQGEGRLTGVPSVFVRLAGCPLRCKWCDTKYAWDQDAGAHMSIDKIINQIQNHRNKFIVITGGEPMINPDLPELLKKLKKSQRHITIETAGIAFMPDLECDLMSISPKLSNSIPDNSELAKIHKDARLDTAVLAELIEKYEYQIKFVVDSQDDIQEIEQTIEQIPNVKRENVMLMPQAATRNELIAKLPLVSEMCSQTGFTLSQRLQILIWDNQRQK